MSWWVCLQHNGSLLHTAEPFEDGGTYVLGGTNECELNVTYNYSKHFHFRELDGKTIAETRELLQAFLDKHGDELPDDDYWKPTTGNTAAAIRRLMMWVKEHDGPTHGQAVWRVS